MVVWGKILPIAGLGIAMLVIANAFTRPAHAQQTASALQSNVAILGTAGEAISSFGRGIGSGLAGLFQPIWEVSNLFERFSTLASGSANVSPVVQNTGSGGGSSSDTYTFSSGGTVSDVPSGVTITGASPGSTWGFL